MIYVDLATGSIELLPLIQKIGQKAERTSLPFGDFMFEGHGPDGPICVGVERKTLHDMMQCITDSRFAGHQMPGMKQLYNVRILMVEGHWKPHDNTGMLMEGFNGGLSWGMFKSRGGKAMYSQIYRYLMSVSLSGFIVMHSRDPWHTAFNVCELYHYFQKPWDKHTSLKEIHRIAVPSLSRKPLLVQKWAHDLEGIGSKLGEMAARHFKKPIDLAQGDESDWLRVPGVGVKTAQQIYREIHGLR